jgi:hypothetical protein
LTPAALAIVVKAFIEGHLQRVGPGRITPECILFAFDHPELENDLRGMKVDYE